MSRAIVPNNKRKFWQFPWRCKESVALVGGVVLVGFLLQLLVGEFDFTLLQWPINIIFGVIITLLPLLISIKRKNPLYQWFSGVPMAVTLIGTLVVLGIIMGLTPQITSGNTVDNLPSRLGFTDMTSSWPFVLVYLITLLSLGTVIVKRITSSFIKRSEKSIFNFQFSIFNCIKDYAFYLNHIGLWLLLFAAGLGAADVKRYVMHVREGETEWRVYNDKNEVLDLPVAIELNDFYREEYPPQLAVIDRKTGAVQPESKPGYFHIDDKQHEGNIDGWNIILKEYIHEAVRNSDSTYHEVHMPGASPAARIEVWNDQKGMHKEGWVCAGNISQLYKVLNLDERYCVAMTHPESKRFVSDINIFTEDGQRKHAFLEVNKPCKIGHWMLYQYGYDNEAGKLSTYSSIELVYDPWVMPVYIGIILLAFGSVCMLWSGNKRKEVNNDME